MENEKMSCVVYRTWYDSAMALEDKEQQRAFMKAMLDYSFTGSYDDSDSIIKALMQTVVFNADRIDKNRKRAQVNGSKSSGNRQYDHEDIIAMRKNGYSRQEVADYFGCHTKTVARVEKEYQWTENQDIVQDLSNESDGQDYLVVQPDGSTTYKF